MWYTILVVLDILVAVALIVLVLLQQGKGADAGAAFGSGSAGTVFGAAGGTSAMTKITIWLAATFFIVTLGLSIIAKERVEQASAVRQPTSVMQDIKPEQAVSPSVPIKKTGVDAIPDATEQDEDAAGGAAPAGSLPAIPEE